MNGQIEGTVTDAAGASIPGGSITITNIETGATRTVASDDGGVYRAPLLPLGTYRVSVEAVNFKRLVREGITLATGQTATIALVLEPGGVAETVTITSDAPIADVAKIDLGRVLNEREVRNLPLVSRNPYNFGLLQANVTGRPNSEFGVPRINANGYARRANYQLDGNNNTQADRAGIRLMPISEVFVSEVQLVTNGFAPEFGNTPGIIFNAVTPAGTNDYRGSISYRFRRPSFSARQFGLPPTSKPATKVDNFTAAIGGPIIRDRWQFYTGFERVQRDLGGEPGRIITVSPANRQALIALGVSPNAFPDVYSIPSKSTFYIARTDVQITDQQRLVGRVNLFRNAIINNNGGGLTTLERTTDFLDASDSVGVQLISTFSPTLLNELRYQYARRNSRNNANENSSTAPAVIISGIASFGEPPDANTILPLETSNQLLDNLTFTRGSHTMKFGAGFNLIDDTRRSGVFAGYTFPNIAAYGAAVSGTNPRGYTRFDETLGEPNIDYSSIFYQFFAQDDWKVTPRLKINYGLRYDLYDVPQADPLSPLELSRNFRVDKSNFAPRLGIVYGLREGRLPTVVRTSAGLYYEAPLLDIYLRALQNNGTRFPNFSLSPGQAGAPAFPNRLSAQPNIKQSIDTVAPDYENLVAFHTNFQIEQALSQNLSVTLGFIHSRGTHLPVYRNINPINPLRTLADGRPVFSTDLNDTSRFLLPNFNRVLIVESVGTSDYTAGTLSLNKRFANGYQLSANYTYSHAIDDAPEQNLVAVVANTTSVFLSDPTNRRRDRGNSLADQRHTFVLSFVGRSTFEIENRFLRRLINDNQIGIITTANSGEIFNITANRDLNNDGVTTGADRPLFIGRNTGRAPNQFNVDLRYSRFVRFSERFNAEIFGEFVNLFNRKSIFQVNGAGIPVNPDGSLIAPLPDFTTRNPVSLDSRQFQLGFKFNF
ncbi:MAG: TonB-dependent receptor [Pyrinomonadaceae bacterium]|nr:TonB-dependent receptor [Pyrinomonadaceae bacterium]